MITLPVLFLSYLLLAQAQAPPSAAPSGAAASAHEATARLETMRRSLTALEVHPLSDRSAVYRLLPEPIFRFTNPVGMSKDGAIFFWLGQDDRPEVAVQVFLRRSDDQWVQEFSSLSPHPLIAESHEGPGWSPAQGGVELKPVPGAPRPAETAEARLRQMRALTQDFVVEDNFQNQNWQRLRLLSKPLARYGKPGTSVLDGALFSFVLGTDPEVYLMIEARDGKEGPEWQYALAPMSTYALRAMWKGKEVWSVPWRGSADRGPDRTFHVRFFQAGE